TARDFFETLREAGVKRVVDIRLSNVSQLAGFTKKTDLEYFLRAINDVDYVHLVELAPTKGLMDDYRKKQIEWAEFERRFGRLLRQRDPAAQLPPADFDNACLLCSEPDPEQCHRRLVARYLQRTWSKVEVKHL
ncbi:MAG: DUF488 family protein, partial [Gemmatimonadales bacterium]|nr:DUF488 family protein [Gemmatimonadales bacterium]